MAKKIAPYIDRCIFNFVELYKKLQTNMPELHLLTTENKQEIAAYLGEVAKKNHMTIQTCGKSICIHLDMYHMHQYLCFQYSHNPHAFLYVLAYGIPIRSPVRKYPVETSIETLKELSAIVGKKRVSWRYDPILLTEYYTVEKHKETFAYKIIFFVIPFQSQTRPERNFHTS